MVGIICPLVEIGLTVCPPACDGPAYDVYVRYIDLFTFFSQFRLLAEELPKNLKFMKTSLETLLKLLDLKSY